MKKLHWFVIKSFIGPFIITFLISLFVLLMQFLFRYIEDIAGKGLEYTIIFKFFFWVSLTLAPVAFPLAILLSSLMTFGKMGEKYELVAMKASGISLLRIMKPLIMLNVVLFGCIIMYTNYIVPYANLKMYSLYMNIMKAKPDMNIREGVFTYLGSGKEIIKVQKKDDKSNMLYNLIIYKHDDSFKNTNLTLAKSGKLYITPKEEYIILELFHGETYEDMSNDPKNSDKKPHRISSFSKRKIIIPLEKNSFENMDNSFLRNKRKMQDLKTLEYYTDSLSKQFEKNLKEFAKILNNRYKIINPKKDSILKNVKATKYLTMDTLIARSGKEQEISALISIVNNNIREKKMEIESRSYSFEDERVEIIKYKIEWHERFTFAFACLIFFFIGAPLGAIIRKGGLGTPVVISVLFFVIYYAIWLILKKMVRNGDMEPFIGMWVSTFILLPVGIFLTYKAVHDSMIMDTTTYGDFLKKIIKHFKKIN